MKWVGSFPDIKPCPLSTIYVVPKESRRVVPYVDIISSIQGLQRVTCPVLWMKN